MTFLWGLAKMMMTEPQAMLQRQFITQLQELHEKWSRHIPIPQQEFAYLEQTRALLADQFDAAYDVTEFKWTRPRKMRQKKLRPAKPVDIWLLNGAKDHACLRYENTLWNQGEGPVPGPDSTHYNCRCVRRQVARPKPDGTLDWFGIRKPRGSPAAPKGRMPPQYKEPLDPYDVTDIRQPEPTYA